MSDTGPPSTPPHAQSQQHTSGQTSAPISLLTRTESTAAAHPQPVQLLQSSLAGASAIASTPPSLATSLGAGCSPAPERQTLTSVSTTYTQSTPTNVGLPAPQFSPAAAATPSAVRDPLPAASVGTPQVTTTTADLGAPQVQELPPTVNVTMAPVMPTTTQGVAAHAHQGATTVGVGASLASTVAGGSVQQSTSTVAIGNAPPATRPTTVHAIPHFPPLPTGRGASQDTQSSVSSTKQPARDMGPQLAHFPAVPPAPQSLWALSIRGS